VVLRERVEGTIAEHDPAVLLFRLVPQTGQSLRRFLARFRVRPGARPVPVRADASRIGRTTRICGAPEGFTPTMHTETAESRHDDALSTGTALAPRPEHRSTRTPIVRRADTALPTRHGVFRAIAYEDVDAGVDHLALVAEGSHQGTGQVPLVRVHSECLTGEALGSLKCECGPQLDAALEMIGTQGGVVIYLRGHEGRGIGLANKIRAYQLQESGADTLDANLALGLPADARNYRAAWEILADLRIEQVRLLTNNPDKVDQLTQAGIRVTDRIGLVVGAGPVNEQYLATKRERMGHLLPR